ncbi:hypothetical protein [Stutzerimonas marianensis]
MNVLRKWEWVLFAITVVSILAYSTLVPFGKHPFSTGLFLCIVATIFLGLALDMRASRIVKGILILGIGSTINLVYGLAVREKIECALHTTCTAEIRTLFNFGIAEGFISFHTIESIILLITVACAGAGGSIIAAHGDISTTDNHSIKNSEINLQPVMDRLDTQSAKLTWILRGMVVILFFLFIDIVSR